MNKMHLALKAKELYQIEHLGADEIAKQLGVSRRTVFNWMKQFDWKKLPPRPLQLWELQTAASAMLKSLEQDTEGKFTKSTINEMLKFFDYVLKEEKEAAKQQKTKKKPKPISHETIRQIERDILGLHRDSCG